MKKPLTTKELSDYLWKLKCNPIKYSYKSNWDKSIQKLLKEYAKQEWENGYEEGVREGAPDDEIIQAIKMECYKEWINKR